MMKKHIKMSDKAFRGGLGLFWSSKEVKMTKCCLVSIRAQAPLEGAWVLWWVPKRVKTTVKDLLRHILTYFHHFWALFCLKPTRNALFTPFLVQNCQVAVTKQVQIGFSRPGPFWAQELSSDPKERRSGHKMHLISSFLGFILRKSDQKCTF